MKFLIKKFLRYIAGIPQPTLDFPPYYENRTYAEGLSWSICKVLDDGFKLVDVLDKVEKGDGRKYRGIITLHSWRVERPLFGVVWETGTEHRTNPRKPHHGPIPLQIAPIPEHELNQSRTHHKPQTINHHSHHSSKPKNTNHHTLFPFPPLARIGKIEYHTIIERHILTLSSQ